MTDDHLTTVERFTLVFAALAIAAAAVAAPRAVAFGVTIGAAVMAANAVAMRRIGARVGKRPGALILLLNLKLLVVIGLVFVLVHYLHVDLLGFLIGISIFPVAIVATAVRHALLQPPDGDDVNSPLHPPLNGDQKPNG